MILIVRNISIINIIMDITGIENLDKALKLLASRLDLAETEPIRLVVCGGSALVARGLAQRATEDVDVVALMDSNGRLLSPAPLPEYLLKAVKEVARDFGLADNWLNNGPSSDESGLFQMGVPEGIEDRLDERILGPRLTVCFIGRYDQIHFKLYAAADSGAGVHLDDLLSLKPNESEIEAAARWAMTHDISPEFKMILKDMLRQIGYESVADGI